MRIESDAQINIARQMDEEDKLFGSVTARDAAEALGEQSITIDDRKVHLPEPVKPLGMQSRSSRLRRCKRP